MRSWFLQPAVTGLLWGLQRGEGPLATPRAEPGAEGRSLQGAEHPTERVRTGAAPPPGSGAGARNGAPSHAKAAPLPRPPKPPTGDGGGPCSPGGEKNPQNHPRRRAGRPNPPLRATGSLPAPRNVPSIKVALKTRLAPGVCTLLRPGSARLPPGLGQPLPRGEEQRGGGAGGRQRRGPAAGAAA